MHSEYKESFITLFDEITKAIEGYQRDEVRIIIVGDLVHQKIIISNEQLILGTWFLRKLEAIAPVVIIAGNHDLLENNKDRMDSISPMVQFLPNENINFFKESKCYLDDNIVWCVYSIFEENKTPNIESARLEFGDDKTYIGLFHAPLINAKTDIGYEFDHGAGLDIFEGCDMVMLGDIHKRQIFIHKQTMEVDKENLERYIKIGWVVDDDKNSAKINIKKVIPICYSGSLIQQDFGENVTKHGFLMWDIETKTFTEYDIENKYSLYQFKIKSLDDLDANAEKITNL